MSEPVSIRDNIDTLSRKALHTPSAGRELDELAKRIHNSHLDELSDIIRYTPELRQAATSIATRYFVARNTTKKEQSQQTDYAWDPVVSSWLTKLRKGASIDDEPFLIASSAITWGMRSSCPEVLNALSVEDVHQAPPSEAEDTLTGVALMLQTARYDFNFKRIDRILNEADNLAAIHSSTYAEAMRLFSRLGQGADVPATEIEDLIHRLLPEKVLSLVLHGLWFTAGHEETDQMLRLCSILLEKNPNDPITFMRRAAAHRRSGDYDLAISAINTALEILPPNEREAHADLKLERVTIAIQQDAKLRLDNAMAAQTEHSRDLMRDQLISSQDTLAGRIDNAHSTFEEQIGQAQTYLEAQISESAERADRQVSDSLFKVVEILGVFTAIVSVIATIVAGNAIGSGVEWWARILIIVTGGIITLGFFVLLRIIVRPDRRKAKT